MGSSHKARLYALVARSARKAAVFRRGPSKSVLVLTWDLTNDSLTVGQWFKGRIYERRCDISPNGELLVYFAAKPGDPLGSWTAISRPPYLKALALWPKGDAWGGGGLFRDSHTLQLNHRPGETRLAEGFSLPTNFRVEPLGSYSGNGEDDPIDSIRAQRDGWTMVSPGHSTGYNRKAPFLWTIDPPRVLEKPAIGRLKAVLRIQLFGVGKREGGAWYVQTAQVESSVGELVADLGRIDWADVDHNGDVLFARQGCLYRLVNHLMTSVESASPSLIADLNDLSFEPLVAPGFARAWP